MGIPKIIEIASNVSTPLALSGIVAAFFFLIVRAIIQKNVFPKLTTALGGEVILTIINRLFILALVAIVLGFFGYVITAVAALSATGARTSHASIGFFSGTTLEDAAKAIVQKYNSTARFSECPDEIRRLTIEPGQLAGATPADLLNALQDRLVNPPYRVKYRVVVLEDAGIFEITCAAPSSGGTPAPARTAEFVSSIGLRLPLVECLGTWVGQHEVTQDEFRAVMGANPSRYQGGDRPVDRICLSDALEFCRRLTAKDRAAGILTNVLAYRLPSEQEFETYFDGSNANEAATSLFERRNGTLPVGSFAPNRYGLYDVLGNVWEWMNDGTLRGACWDTAEWRDAQVGYRLVPNPNYNCQNFGFRCVLAPAE